jgi:hypothetical protein
MAKIEIYPSKLKAILFLIICLLISIGGIYFFKIIFLDKSLFLKTIFFLGFLLFVFGFFYALFLLFRKSPLLIINEDEIVTLYPFRKSIIIKFSEIQSFGIIESSFRGFTSNREILIELINTSDKYQRTDYYKILKRISVKLANTQYSIQTNFLNIDYKDLLKILNQRLKKQHLVTTSIK